MKQISGPEPACLLYCNKGAFYCETDYPQYHSLFPAFPRDFIAGTQGDKVYAMIADFLEQDSGVLTVVSVDAQRGYPIKNSKFQIIDAEKNEVIEVIETSIDGVATTSLLPLSRNYYVQQTNVLEPYQLNTDQHELMLSSENNRITIEIMSQAL
ncbi:hypothetical protein CV093_16565 [Oceanobacillus sp. 143]|nr:hypothetical protein CV093_16565 [Oceanobacillus sp. 143]